MNNPWLKLQTYMWAAEKSKVAGRPLTVAFIGDSITEGLTALTPDTNWQGRVRKALNKRFGGGVTDHVGYIPAGYSNGFTAPGGGGEPAYLGKRYWQRGAGDASQNDSGAYQYFMRMSTGILTGNKREINTATCDGPFSCDRIFLAFSGAGINTQAKVTLDGGTPTVVNISAGGSGMFLYDSGTLTLGTHTVKVECNAGTSGIIFDGGLFINGTWNRGVWCYDGGVSGSQAQHWVADTSWDTGMGNIKPDLVFLALGTNDLNVGGRTKAQYKTDMQSIITRLNAVGPLGRNASTSAYDRVLKPSIVLVHNHASSATNMTTHGEYKDALDELAASNDNCIVVDMQEIYGQGTGDTNDKYERWLLADNLHPWDNGYVWYANVALDALDLAQYAF